MSSSPALDFNLSRRSGALRRSLQKHGSQPANQRAGCALSHCQQKQLFQAETSSLFAVLNTSFIPPGKRCLTKICVETWRQWWLGGRMIAARAL